MVNPQASLDELWRILHRTTPQFEQAYFRLAASLEIRVDSWGRISVVETKKTPQARKDLAKLLGDTNYLADLFGRRRTLLNTDAIARRRGAKLIDYTSPVIPHVDPDDAIEAILARYPRIARDSSEVSRLYREGRAFALAGETELKVVGHIRDTVARLTKEGKSVDEATAELLKESGALLRDWTRSFAETVYRTNISTAYTDGRRKMAEDPDIYEITPAWKYHAILDATVRPNHKAAHGLIADKFWPEWKTYAPPLSWNCRCSLLEMDAFELKRQGLLKDGRVVLWKPPGFDAAGPDPGFKMVA
jgi:SPP1 gp7 family putative phage head morphogenesis protein